MKLPEALKKAVLSEDWHAICAVYTALTGEKLSPPDKPKEIDFTNFEIPDELLEAPVDGNSLDEVEDPSIYEVSRANHEDWLSVPEAQPEAPKKKEDSFIAKAHSGDGRPDFTKKKEGGKVEARKESMSIPKQRKNRFVDNLSVATKDLKSHNEQLQKLYSTSSGRVPRLITDEEEQEAAPIEVVCCLCEEPDLVAKALAIGYDSDPEKNSYHCNSCSTPSGRAKALRKRKELVGPRRK